MTGRRRIMVIGSGGAGKTTFSRELAARTGLPLVHLDRHYWNPGWVATPSDVWHARVRELSSADAWIMDGNYSSTLGLRLQRCDAVVFFDFPPLVCIGGVLRRWARYRFGQRPDLPEGCPEKLDLAFLRWVWDYGRRTRPRIVSVLEQAGPELLILTFTRRTQARAALDAAAGMG